MSPWNPLRRLLGEAQPSQPPEIPQSTVPAAAPARAPAPAAPAAAGGTAPAELALRRGATARLLGCEALHGGPATAAEQAVVERLAALARGGLDADLVPRLPAVLPRLMSLARRDDVAPRELAELVARDPALVGEVVRLANSAHFLRAREITDLQGAVLVLGQTGLLQLVTRVAARPIFNLAQGRFGRQAGGLLWELTERCAHACAFLRSGQADAFAAYLAGMGAWVGFIAAVRVLDQGDPAPQAPASEDFHDALWQQAAWLSVHATRQWSFPEAAQQALTRRAAALGGGHGPAGDAAPQALVQALHAAERAALRQTLGPTGRLPPGEPAPAAPEDEARAWAELERAYPAPTPAAS